MKKRSTAYRLNKVDYLIFIFCSLAAAFMLFLFYRDLTSFTIKQAESPVAKIYYKKNTVQRKYLDNEIWEVLNDSSDIYDGDRIRTSKNSEVYTEFSDSGIQIQIHENSMVQIFKTKSQHSINFIGGEIFVANNSPEEKLVIHSGKKEISVSQSSEVKLALPEVSKAVAAGAEEAVEDDNTVVIEVVSGQVEVSEHAKKPETGSQISEPMVVSAGEKITLLPTVGEIAKEKTDIVAGIAESAAVEEPVVVEKKVETEEAKETVEILETEKTVAEKVEISENEEPAVVKTEAPAVTQTVIPTQSEPVVILPEPITVGVEKKYERGTVYFQRNDYDRANGKYNYGTGCDLFEVTEKDKTIPAGTALEFTMKGISNKDISRWAIQISTGEEEWVQAHPFKNSFGNDGKGITANEPFTYKTVYVLNKPIVNTNSSWVNICYDPEILDEGAVIRNFEVSAKVLSVNAANERKNISSGYKKTLEFESISFSLEHWGEKDSEYEFKISMDSADIFGDFIIIPKGTKIKITISGTCDRDFKGMRPDLIDNTENEWIEILMDNDNRDYEAAKINNNATALKNKEFSYSKEYITYSDLPDTSSGIFYLQIDNENNRNKPTFTNLKISFEVE
ncbi:MAG: FecR domain-containing protein [Spirochaetales bacterium]|nr:FecR domain-containing protein [Spirochaetales bacterium]